MIDSPIHSQNKTPDGAGQEIAELLQQYADIVYAPEPFVAGETPSLYQSLARSSALQNSKTWLKPAPGRLANPLAAWRRHFRGTLGQVSGG
jgi:hypothetical protein